MVGDKTAHQPAKYKIPFVYTDYQEMIKQAELDAVVVVGSISDNLLLKPLSAASSGRRCLIPSFKRVVLIKSLRATHPPAVAVMNSQIIPGVILILVVIIATIFVGLLFLLNLPPKDGSDENY